MAIINVSHPPIKNTPPIGVTAPNMVTPLKARIYRLPEKSIIPEAKKIPAQAIHLELYFSANIPKISIASA